MNVEVTTNYTYKGKNVADLSHGEAIRALITAYDEIISMRNARAKAAEAVRNAPKGDSLTSVIEAFFGKK